MNAEAGYGSIGQITNVGAHNAGMKLGSDGQINGTLIKGRDINGNIINDDSTSREIAQQEANGYQATKVISHIRASKPLRPRASVC